MGYFPLSSEIICEPECIPDFVFELVSQLGMDAKMLDNHGIAKENAIAKLQVAVNDIKNGTTN